MCLEPTESSDVENACGQKYEEGHIKDRGCTHIFPGDSRTSSSIKVPEPSPRQETHGVQTSPALSLCMQSPGIMTQATMLSFWYLTYICAILMGQSLVRIEQHTGTRNW